MVLTYCITCFSPLVLVITNTKKWIAASTLPCQGLRCQEFIIFSYWGGFLLLTTFYVTIYVTRTDSEISVEGTIIILTSIRNVHLHESVSMSLMDSEESSNEGGNIKAGNDVAFLQQHVQEHFSVQSKSQPLVRSRWS